MKRIIICSLLVLFSCCKKIERTEEAVEILKTSDATPVEKKVQPGKTVATKYSNERFRDVTVQKLGNGQIRITGQGQIFEASFSYIVTDGYHELASGSAMTDAGAPEWGKFDFSLDSPKKDTISNLILVLFEASAKDGSRQHQLRIPLNR